MLRELVARLLAVADADDIRACTGDISKHLFALPGVEAAPPAATSGPREAEPSAVQPGSKEPCPAGAPPPSPLAAEQVIAPADPSAQQRGCAHPWGELGLYMAAAACLPALGARQGLC